MDETERSILVLTVQHVQIQPNWNRDEINKQEESVEVCMHAGDASYDTNSKKTYTELVNTYKAYRVECLPQSWVAEYLNLCTTTRKWGTIQALKTILSSPEGMLRMQLFPTITFGTSSRIQDWVGCTHVFNAASFTVESKK